MYISVGDCFTAKHEKKTTFMKDILLIKRIRVAIYQKKLQTNDVFSFYMEEILLGKLFVEGKEQQSLCELTFIHTKILDMLKMAIEVKYTILKGDLQLHCKLYF